MCNITIANLVSFRSKYFTELCSVERLSVPLHVSLLTILSQFAEKLYIYLPVHPSFHLSRENPSFDPAVEP
jgi:hypothetical protein